MGPNTNGKMVPGTMVAGLEVFERADTIQKRAANHRLACARVRP
jgi:hypothetical protein